MKLKGLTAMKFAEMLDVQPSNISHILSGRNKPSYDFIVKLLERFTDVNPQWLLLGIGDIYTCNNNAKSTGFTNVNTVDPLLDFTSSDEKFDANTDITSTPQRCDYDCLPASVAGSTSKDVVKIIFIYSDKSFEVFDNH
ncbi:hypothetical protein BN938_0017 [Mucinivorans hirudinis]|uniref:HTH cro/C1-type domain-containing protein n=1 Tax=Mucinivorans hirudinis TaxID=1433126 RepID=A0A060R9M0_9BACT|nr:hypothetical protein BN938_0017 [Mucinivorans hirudinis]